MTTVFTSKVRHAALLAVLIVWVSVGAVLAGPPNLPDGPLKLTNVSGLAKIPDAAYKPARGDKVFAGTYVARDDTLLVAGAYEYEFELKEHIKSIEVDDHYASMDSLKSGSLTYLPIGTSILVLEVKENKFQNTFLTCVEVRVLSGKLEGKKFWMLGMSAFRLVENPKAKANRADSLIYPEKLRASGQLGAAIEAYKLVDIMYPGTPEAAKAREQIGRIEKEMAKKLDDTRAARLLTMAKNLDKSGKRAAALDYYAQVVKAAPKSKEAAEASRRVAELRK